MLPTARRGDVCLCVYVPVLECSIPLGWGLCVCFLCVCVRGCACVSVWNDASPCLVCDVSTHTTGQLTARQHSVYACAFVCVMGGGEQGRSHWREKERGGAVCEQKEVGCRESLKPICVHA